MQHLRRQDARRSFRRQRGRGVIAVASAALAALGIAACGSSSHRAALPLSAYLVHPGEQTGFHQVGGPSYLATPAQFDSGDPNAAADNRVLVRAGFRRAIILHTAGADSSQGISNVVELSSPANARQAQTAFITQSRALMSAHGPAPAQSTVAGVPDAVDLSDDIAANVIYVQGRCLVIVGDETQSASPRTPAAAGAHAIYARTHSHLGACLRQS